jgi:hypothetical protein
MIPMCWKCSCAKFEDEPDMPGVKNFIGCRDNPQIEQFEHAQALCPLLEGSREQIRMEVAKNRQ